MPKLTSVSPSISAVMSTGYKYHTTLTATWISDYVYDIVLSITRESNEGDNGWDVKMSHGYRLIYYQKDGTLYDSGKVSLYGTPIQTGTAGAAGESGWVNRTATIFSKRIETHPTNRHCIAEYYATLDNSKYGGSSSENKDFWAPSSKISEAPLLPDGPNTYVYSNGKWVRAKDIFVYSGGAWKMVPSGDLNVYSNKQWKS